MASPVKIRSKAGTTRAPGGIQVPVNTQDVSAAVEQLQDTVNAIIVWANAHVHGSSGAGAPTTTIDGTKKTASGFFTTPATS